MVDFIMTWSRYIGLLFSYLAYAMGNGDPCLTANHKVIPNMGLRYVNFIITSSDKPFHDYLLTEGWYMVGNDTMPETPPEQIFSCGTKFPVWLNGSHPVEASPVNGIACQFSLFGPCQRHYDIQIKKCPGGLFAYYLPATASDAGYCFGIGKKGTRPKYVPAKPSVAVNLRVIPSGSSQYSRVEFICDFIRDMANDLWYQVSWLSQGQVVYTTPFGKGNKNDVFNLTEELFKHRGFRLGENISCTARAFNEYEGPPGGASAMSDNKFVGIEIQTQSLEFKSDESNVSKRSIHIKPTIPIGCQGESCDILLRTFVPDQFGKCSGIALDNSVCGVRISSNTSSSVYTIPIKAVDTKKYQINDDVYEVYLKTDDITENLIWGNYELPKIAVTIKPPSETVYQGKRCSAYNDPHMTTFDGRHYDNHQDGVYTLYKHVKFETEVQIQHEKCNTRSQTVMCTCGVAVRAGTDVYVLSACQKMWNITYRSCSDRTITVKSNGEAKYKIYFSYGTIVDVSISALTFGGTNDGNRIMEVSVIASHADQGGATRGLCGSLDEDCRNDFHDRDGHYTNSSLMNDPSCKTLNWKNQPEVFTDIWRISSNKDNLFHEDLDFTKFKAWEHKVCACGNSTQCSGYKCTTKEICDLSTVVNCTRGKIVGTASCDSKTRRRRSVVTRQPMIPAIVIPDSSSKELRNKRQALTKKNWTETEARDFCTKYMGLSPVFSLCEKVPNARPDSAIETCVMDIMITGGTQWSSISMETMQDSCLSEVDRNTTLSEKPSALAPSLAQLIEEKACSNNCSEVGTCIKGKCICDTGFGGTDCSIDLNRGPTISGLLDNGLCDEQHLSCDHAYVFGHIFTDSSNISCRLDEFSISESGVRSPSKRHYIHAEFETLVEVMCPIHLFRKRRSAAINDEHTEFVFGYTISVSNDGNVFEDGKDLFVYDSVCQLVQNINNKMHFSLKDNFCFIDNGCIINGGVNTKDNCFICDTNNSTRHWSFNEGINECLLKYPEMTRHDDDDDDVDKHNYLWIIGAVAGVVAGAILATVVVLKLMKNRAKTVDDWTLFKQSKKYSVTKPNTD